MKKKLIGYNAVSIGVLSFFMMLLIMLPSMISNHGIFVVRGDYIDQYIPKLLRMKHILSSGTGWDWYTYLGGAFDNSIFSLHAIAVLFSDKLIPYAVTYLNMIRFSIIAMASFLYFDTMVHDKQKSAFGAIIYTFSAYTFLNFEFMQFMDNMWLMPLLLWSVEKMFTSDKYRHTLIIIVALNAIKSSYFFVFSTIMFTVYFLCRFFFSDEWREKRNIKWFIIAVVEYTLGFLLSAFTFTSFITGTLSSSGSADAIGSKISIGSLLYDGRYVAKLFSFFVPAASNRFSTFGYSSWSSYAAYVPVFSISLCICYFVKKGFRDWLSLVIIVMVISFMIPAISLVYNAFSSTYTRYAYGLILFMVLATISVLPDKGEPMTRYAVITVTLTALLICGYYLLSFLTKDIAFFRTMFYRYASDEANIESQYRLFVIVSTAVFSAALLLISTGKLHRNAQFLIVIVTIIGYGMAYTVMNIKSDNLTSLGSDIEMTVKETVESYFVKLPELKDKGFYRIDSPYTCINYSFVTGKPSIATFDSTRNAYADESVEYTNSAQTSVVNAPNDDNNATRTLFGVKYYINYAPEKNNQIPQDFRYSYSDNGCDIYENEKYKGMGFTYDKYIKRSELDEIAKTRENCSDIMLNALVIDDNDVDLVSDMLTPYDGEPESSRISFDEFTGDSKGFRGRISLPEAKIVYVPVPYEKTGWHATNNGKEMSYFKGGVGFIAFKGEAGENNIEFTYSNPVRKKAYVIVIVDIILILIYLAIYKKTISRKLMKK